MTEGGVFWLPASWGLLPLKSKRARPLSRVIDQLVDEYRLILSDAVGSVGGLVLYGGIPPGVVVDYRISLHEIESYAACFETDEKDLRFAFGESGDRFVPLAGRTGQLGVGDISFPDRSSSKK